MTNYERIKNMTVEEMVEFIGYFTGDSWTYCVGGKNGFCFKIPCEKGIKMWLESEFKE